MPVIAYPQRGLKQYRVLWDSYRSACFNILCRSVNLNSIHCKGECANSIFHWIRVKYR